VNNPQDLERAISGLMKSLGALKVGFSSVDSGWEMAIEGCHPKDIMPSCNSVIVLAIRSGLNEYLTTNFENMSVDVDGKTYRVSFLFAEWLTLKLSNFLRDGGYKTVVPSDWSSKERWYNEKDKIHRLSFKLAAYESGIGVFGRSGIIVTPECGPRIRLGALLTNAKLFPTGTLRDFDPCTGCQVCAKLCPIRAIDAGLPPPKGFDRRKCVSFVYHLREKTKNKIYYCGVCFENCPVASGEKGGFELSAHGSLRKIKEETRKSLLNEWQSKEPAPSSA
jgi:epoxyqueuosine reductase QueG